MIPFEYFSPVTLAETAAILTQFNGQAKILAGGTDLLVEIKEGICRPTGVVNLKKIPGLDSLTYNDASGLIIGALTTVRQVETSPLVQQHYPALVEAARTLGSIQVRNRATVAGNICRASPSADTPQPLIAADARVTIFNPAGERTVPRERTVPLVDFFTGPGQTLLASNEILLAITVPPLPPHTGQVYLKHGRRRAMELATVGVAVTLTLEGDVCRNIRIVLGAVAPTPLRAVETEAVLTGVTFDDAIIEQAAQMAMTEARPISDVRASDDYRREMVGVLTRRAIRLALERARSV
jgi:carbon-monoxide dehydrogenase medium subunit